MNRTPLRGGLRKAVYLLLVAGFTFGCALPSFPFPASQATPTAYQEPLPPALVEVSPPDGSQIGLTQAITFYFNQPMDRDALEAALFGLPPGSLTWEDEATLTFTPGMPYATEAEITLAILTSALAANGLALAEPVTLTYTTAPALRAINFLPEPGSQDINPASAVAVTFNQPVVALGAEEGLPEAFTLEPPATGRGAWLSTSTYVFYPDPALSGGEAYTAILNSELQSVTGAPLEGEKSTTAWSFESAAPRLVAISPAEGEALELEPAFKLTFNQAMDPASVEAGFSLQHVGLPVQGQYSWSEDRSVMTFRPDERLERNSLYALALTSQAKAAGGTPLESPAEYEYLTYDDFEVSSSEPAQGGVKAENTSLRVYFSAPVMDADDLEELVEITPQVPGLSISLNEQVMNLYGFFAPETSYSLSISPELADRWGQPLDTAFRLAFRTAAVAPRLYLPYGGEAVFVKPEESVLYADATNIESVEVRVDALTFDQFQTLLGPGGYQARQSYTFQNPATYTRSYRLRPSRNETIALPLASSGRQLAPGLYFVRFTSPQLGQGVGEIDDGVRPVSLQPGGGEVIQNLVVASSVNLTFKAGATDALVWAVDLRTQSPVAGAPVAVYDYQGSLLASGSTDDQGIWQGDFEPPEQAYRAMMAVVGEVGQETFGLAFSSWNQGVSPWEFGVSYSRRAPRTQAYLYTDRPIYRPGQTVSFRGVVRQAFDARYDLPARASLALEIQDPDGHLLQSFDLPLSPYGTVHGDYRLSVEAPPGTYRLFNDELETSLYFEVAEYRVPEFELQAAFGAVEVSPGAALQAEAGAQYYFGAPASDLEAQWSLYERADYFSLPGYQTGVFDDSWLNPYWPRGYFSSRTLGSGTGRTDAQGGLDLDLPAAPQTESPRRLILEVTAQDESGFPVSARAETLLHPAEVYIGVRPEQWIGQSGTELAFEVFTVDWERQPSPSLDLQAVFKQVRWERADPPPEAPYESPQYEAVYTLVDSSSLSTGQDGKARITFTPEEPGTYVLDVAGQGARTQVLLWVGGPGSVAWPRLLNDQVRLTADQGSYQPGQEARIFIPNPFGVPAQALVTVERGRVLQAQVLTLEETGATFSLPLEEGHAPNVFVSATLLDAEGGFRLGYLNLEVSPQAQELQVELTARPEISQPRGEVTLGLRVSDHQGNPVQGEFSLAVVDKAVLALADPNSEGIFNAFYGEQPLGVETGLSLAVYSGRSLNMPGGGGGGGGEGAIPFVRERFEGTAYWNPTFTTDANGQAQVTVTLPDNLTTWLVETRGLTLDTRVGEAQSEVVSTRPVLIRPVTPRFLVAGDRVELAAIVHNNTADDLQAQVGLQAAGFALEAPEAAAREVALPAGERVRVAWWGTAEEAAAADLVFSVEARGAEGAWVDSARPAFGPLPILSYTSPQAFLTSGMLAEAGERQEVVSLPRTYDPTSGGLEVELTGSLAANLLAGLEDLPVPDCTCNNEAVLSYLLPNLEAYRALQASGMQAPGLQERLDASLRDGVIALVRNQNDDGGWGWLQGSPSDGHLTAYALFGLARAREAGAGVPERTLEDAQAYLRENQFAGGAIKSLEPWQLDRLAFAVFAMHASDGLDSKDENLLDALNDSRDRMSPWAWALLALAIEGLSPGDERARDLIANLEAGAVRTASSANWESETGSWRNPGTPLYTTAVVVYAMAQRDPAAPVMVEAVRYLVSNRDAHGLWGSTYESAWVVLALAEAMEGLGELQADFVFSAAFNGVELASGEARGTELLEPVRAHLPLEALSADAPNALTIAREEGQGRLYYRAALSVSRPVEGLPASNRGLSVSRAYYNADCERDCTPITSLDLASGARLTARLTLTLPHDSYYLVLDDYIPAGAELLNRALKTSQGMEDDLDVRVVYDERAPFSRGWGWWYFNEPQFHDERITWTADYLPAGTYELAYTLIPAMAGEFRVLPAIARLAFFPDVRGSSAGTVFEIRP